MNYVSTRGQAPHRDFSGVLLAGLAEDGGLFMPETWPHLSHADLRALRGLPYAELAARVIALFTGATVPFGALQAICRDSYAGFRHPATIPLVQLAPGLWSLELFHGPTLAFKDLAMQPLGRLFDHALAERGPARHHRGCHVRRHRLGRPSRRAAAARASTSSSCIRPGAPARCSAGR